MAGALTQFAQQCRALDWHSLAQDLASDGFALCPAVLDAASCAEVTAWYDREQLFRKTVNMAQHQFGSGEYKYFAYPLDAGLQQLRATLYAELAPIANHWAQLLKLPVTWPGQLDEFLTLNSAAGQTRPTPLMLSYQAGDYNCLHQDKYGELYFPFQALVLLSTPGQDFSGGEFVLVENRPRLQSSAKVVPLKQGQLLIFPNQTGLRKGARGYCKSQFRHGVSKIHSGQRKSLGIIFHDAR